MKLIFSPARMETSLIASVDGDSLILNEEQVDLSSVKEGIPCESVDSHWILTPVQRLDGVLHVTLVLPHGAHPPVETMFPDSVDITSGPVPLPPFDSPEESDADRQN